MQFLVKTEIMMNLTEDERTLKYFSTLDRLLSSAPSSKAVNIGSLLDSDMYASLARPRYAFRRYFADRSMSNFILFVHSWQAQRNLCGFWIISPRRSNNCTISYWFFWDARIRGVMSGENWDSSKLVLKKWSSSPSFFLSFHISRYLRCFRIVSAICIWPALIAWRTAS